MSKQLQTKVVIVGDAGVGKTSFLLRFIRNEFSETSSATINQHFLKKTIEVEDTPIQFEVWDTAGQERYRSLTASFYRNANGVIIMFNVSHDPSFVAIKNWLHDVNYHGIPSKNCLLVGNKIDMERDHNVNECDVGAFAEKHELKYIETSVKNDINVGEAFIELGKQMLNNRLSASSTIAVKLNPKSGNVQEKKGCRC